MDDNDGEDWIRALKAKGFRLCTDTESVFIHCLTGWEPDDFVIRDPQGRITTYISNGTCAKDPKLDDGFAYPRP